MFRLTKKSKKSNARTGIIKTNHGSIHTPCFLPDATRASIRGLTSDDLKRLGLQSMVVNTYHLYLQPGISRIKKSDGIHKFMNWDGPLVSDSGGYQVFSLIYRDKKLGKIKNTGVEFRSTYDGSSHLLTPKKSIQLQFDLGTDLMVCFDDVPPHDIGKKGMSSSIKHTIAWAKICKKEFENQIKKRKLGAKRPLLFAVIQGGSNIELRKKCFEALCQVGFSAKGGPASGWDGFGFGARPVDSEGNFLEDVLDYTARLIPDDKIRFNLGMGTPSDIVRSVKMGWDLFDCVIPTREARHGRLYLLRHPEQASPAKRGKAESTRHKLREGSRESRAASNRRDPSLPQRVHWVVQDDVSINITNSKFSTDLTPINQSSKLPELREYTKAYLHHLFKTAEPLSIRLATLNNVEFYMGLMSDIRMAISKNEI